MSERIQAELNNKKDRPKRGTIFDRWKKSIGDFANSIISAEEEEEK